MKSCRKDSLDVLNCGGSELVCKLDKNTFQQPIVSFNLSELMVGLGWNQSVVHGVCSHVL
eukprot:4274868-Amphidinium_carterae.1